MAKWEISKSQGRCFGTDKPIAAGEPYFAALVETEDGFQRCDYCLDYWQDHQPKAYCFWKTKFPEEGKKAQLFIDDQMLMMFFERLEGETSPEKINFRFVLMLVLMRKRKLKYDSSIVKDDQQWWRLKVAASGGREVEVLNPQIDQEQIEQLSGQIGEIMQVDLDE